MDYDDFYSLSEYASKFSHESYKLITHWFSQVSVISRIEMFEKKNGNELFRESILPLYLEKIDNDELLDIEDTVNALSIESIFVEDGEVFAHGDIYYDFVGYLMIKGIVR